MSPISVSGKVELRRVYATQVADADAQAYIAAVETADGQALEYGVASAISDFVVGCKADGIWNAIKASCILAGARTLAGALVPLKGTAPTNNNFVSGDYDRKTGLVGNASTKYLNSNRNNDTDPQNSYHLAVYAQTVASGSTSYAGMFDSLNGNLLQRFNSYHYGYARSSTSAPAGGTGNITAGLVATTRSSSASFTTRTGKTDFSVTNNSVAPISRNTFIFGRNDGPGLTEPTDARLSFYSIGESLDLALLDSRVTTLMNAIGAAIP